jgi:hypothetical protein
LLLADARLRFVTNGGDGDQRLPVRAGMIATNKGRPVIEASA